MNSNLWDCKPVCYQISVLRRALNSDLWDRKLVCYQISVLNALVCKRNCSLCVIPPSTRLSEKAGSFVFQKLYFDVPQNALDFYLVSDSTFNPNSIIEGLIFWSRAIFSRVVAESNPQISPVKETRQFWGLFQGLCKNWFWNRAYEIDSVRYEIDSFW